MQISVTEWKVARLSWPLRRRGSPIPWILAAPCPQAILNSMHVTTHTSRSWRIDTTHSRRGNDTYILATNDEIEHASAAMQP